MHSSATTFELSPRRLRAAAVRHRLLAYRLCLWLSALTVGATILTPRSWTVPLSFLPQVKEAGGLGGLTGLAAQFGVAVPSGAGGTTPDLYVEVLRSQPVLLALLQEPIEGRPGETVRSLLVGDDSSTAATVRALRELREFVKTSVQASTGTVRLEAVTRDPALSLTLAQRLLAAAERFDLTTRRTQAAAERAFTEARLREATAALVDAEDRLEAFTVANRDYERSPRLATSFQRLNREVGLRQQLVLTLSDAFEKARIDEVRDTPVITVLEPPAAPLAPDGRNLVLKLLLALVAALAVSAVWALAREYSAAADSTSQPEGASLSETLRDDLRHPVRTVRSVVFGAP